MTVGAVVLAYRDASYRRVVEGLLAAGVARERILVVQNPSDPGEAPVDPAFPSLRMPGNVGYGAAMNAGVRARAAAGDERVLLLTHDTLLERSALDALLAASERAQGFGALGPTIQFRGETDERLTFGGYHGADGAAGHRVAPALAPDCPAIGECDWIDGCAMLVRVDAFVATGGFEERFFMYYEDTELCLRLRRAGWRVGVALDARISSQPGKHLRPGAAAFLFTRNVLEFQRRAGGRQLAGELRRQLRELLGPARDLARPRKRRTRAQAWITLCGKVAGFAAFAARRFGPPPRRLPGLGDVRVRSPR